MKIVRIYEQNLSAFSPLLNPDYERQLRSGMLHAFGAVVRDVAEGILVFGVKKEGLFLLHDLSVAPAYRQKGIAAELLTWFTQLALDEGAPVLTSFDDTPDSAVRRLLEKCGFAVTDSIAKSFVVPLKALRGITVLDGMKYMEQVKPVASENGLLWKRFCGKQEERGNTLLSISYAPEAEPELNLCIRQGAEIAGCVIGKRLSENRYELSHACTGEKQFWALMPLLAAFRENLLNMGEPSAELSMTAVTEASVRLAQKLMPEECVCVGRKQAVFGVNASGV